MYHWYNAGMFKMKLLAVGFVILTSLMLSACAQDMEPVTATPSPTLGGTLRPYPTGTPTHTPWPTDYVTPTPTPTVTPTATQVFYEVQEGDDMYSIGWRFKISPQEIMTANPDVNPRSMSIGESLFIPITPAPEATPTEMVELTPTATQPFEGLVTPDCYPDALGGLWCFVLVENEETEALENISAIITIGTGDEKREEIAIMPLNLLPAGESLPLIAYFPPPISQTTDISAKIDFFLPVMPDDQRYLPVTIENQSVDFNQNGMIAKVSGSILLPAGEPQTRYIWVAGTAFDEDGQVVAIRRWDSERQLSGGERVEFELFLYSLGNPIDRVNLMVEAQPVIENDDQ